MDYQAQLLTTPSRNDEWLKSRFEQIWNLLYSDVERLNTVHVRFKGRWKNKFGHITTTKNKDSEIVVNGLLKNPKVPEYMIDITLAHEIAHYAHGFHSPHQKKYKHPHKGGVVTKELQKRGFSHMLRLEKDFLKKEWPKLVKELKT